EGLRGRRLRGRERQPAARWHRRRRRRRRWPDRRLRLLGGGTRERHQVRAARTTELHVSAVVRAAAWTALHVGRSGGWPNRGCRRSRERSAAGVAKGVLWRVVPLALTAEHAA